MYQRSKIQEESLYYETLKHDGSLPIIASTRSSIPRAAPRFAPPEVIRATTEEKHGGDRGARTRSGSATRATAPGALDRIKRAALDGDNVFAALIEACKVCTLGSSRKALYEVGGQYAQQVVAQRFER